MDFLTAIPILPVFGMLILSSTKKRVVILMIEILLEL
jgi:hypothetical protein